MIYVAIDIETTSIDPENGQILEFGAIIEDTNNLNPLHSLPIFHCYIKHEIYYGSPFALAMNHKILKLLSDNEDKDIIYPNEVVSNFTLFLSNNGIKDEKNRFTITVAGKNVGNFDLQFLKRLPEWNNVINIRHRTIDPAILFVDWNRDDTLPSLSECKRRMGLDEEVKHTTIEDSLDVIRLLRTQYHYNTII